jgi:indolepyruvate ferredoxin oxidoreductase beta subunit
VLPFSRAQFEATIERGGVGVKPSLRAFELGFSRADVDTDTDASSPTQTEQLQSRLKRPRRAIPPSRD